jgi:AcrR family transcriptional regulator
MARRAREQTADQTGLAELSKVTKGARTRSLIKQTIVELLEENGGKDVSLEEICDRAGLTVGAFYFHFKSKDAALEELTADLIRATYSEYSASPIQSTLYGELYWLIALHLKRRSEHPVLYHLPYRILPRSVFVYPAERSGLIIWRHNF